MCCLGARHCLAHAAAQVAVRDLIARPGSFRPANLHHASRGALAAGGNAGRAGSGGHKALDVGALADGGVGNRTSQPLNIHLVLWRGRAAGGRQCSMLTNSECDAAGVLSSAGGTAVAPASAEHAVGTGRAGRPTWVLGSRPVKVAVRETLSNTRVVCPVTVNRYCAQGCRGEAIGLRPGQAKRLVGICGPNWSSAPTIQGARCTMQRPRSTCMHSPECK